MLEKEAMSYCPETDVAEAKKSMTTNTGARMINGASVRL